MKFRVGDKVRCISKASNKLEFYKVYEVTHTKKSDYRQWIGVKNIEIPGYPANWCSSCFELYESKQTRRIIMNFLTKLFGKPALPSPKFKYSIQVELVVYDKQSTRDKIPVFYDIMLDYDQEKNAAASLVMEIDDRLDTGFFYHNRFKFKQDKKHITIPSSNIARYEYEYQILGKEVLS